MTAREAGFLLLTCRFGDPGRKVLTPAQLRELTICCRRLEKPVQTRELTKEDLARLGCSRMLAERVVGLLSEVERMRYYLQDSKLAGCVPITRISREYPGCLRDVLGPEAPGSLWAKGDLSLLGNPMVALVGSRDLNEANRRFAEEAGRQAALQGYTLVSGNARGADRTAQDACLKQGGTVVSIVADRLSAQKQHDRMLYLSEEGFDLAFSSYRALQRNRLIHSLGRLVLVAQCRLERGGTWRGTENNLRKNCRPVCCYADGSAAMAELAQRGAELITIEDLQDLSALCSADFRFL